MIIGAHAIVYSSHAEADRAFLRDVLALPNVDVGDGWLIFGLPPAELAVHPSDAGDVHEIYLLCDDVEVFVADMARRGVSCGPVQDRGWGLLTEISLPGGGKLGVYQPRHPRPKTPGARPPSSQGARRAGRRLAGKSRRKPVQKRKGRSR